MNSETDHVDPQFQQKKTAYFQDFFLRHLTEAREFKRHGLLNEKGAKEWRNVARHQLLSAVMTQTVAELIKLPHDKVFWLTNVSLTHDVNKRREQEGHLKAEVIEKELHKDERPLVATSSNFTGFSEWGIYEYILRYVDSSVGEDPNDPNAGQWLGPRDPNTLPDVLIVPWRQRVKMFRENKEEEGKRGKELYEMSTWDKLEQIMTTIEQDLFGKIIKKNPDLAKTYTQSSRLTELVENRIHENIMSS